MEYVTLAGHFLTKNTPGGLTGWEFRMCCRIQDPAQVAALNHLIRMLHPAQDRIFQRILDGCRSVDGSWSANVPFGHNSLADSMKKLSCWANLSKRYTNHCVWASVVTDLTDAAFSQMGKIKRSLMSQFFIERWKLKKTGKTSSSERENFKEIIHVLLQVWAQPTESQKRSVLLPLTRKVSLINEVRDGIHTSPKEVPCHSFVVQIP